MSDLEPCDSEIYENGVVAFVTHSIPSEKVEEFVTKVCEDSGEPVDWHFMAGRAMVLTTGDVDTVREAVKANRKMHDQFYRDRWGKRCPGIWKNNELGNNP